MLLGKRTIHDKGVYFHDGQNWVRLQRILEEPEWIGGTIMSSQLEEVYANRKGYFSPVKTYTPYYRINNWGKKEGSHNDFTVAYGWLIQLSTSGDLSSGNYKITYGGGEIDFFMGKKFRVMLYAGGRLVDDYYIENPTAEDAEQCNFWEAEAQGVMIPVREATIYVYNNQTINIELRVVPQYVVLDWDVEIGPNCANQQAWLDAGSPVFGQTSGYVCNPQMKSIYCGPSTSTKDGPNQFYDYWYSLYYMKALNGCAGGIISGVFLDIYKIN